LLTSTRNLSLLKDRRGVAAFSQALFESGRDFDFVDFWSVPVALVASVAEHMRHGGVDPEEVLLHEPRSAVLQLQTFAELTPELQWTFTVRYWPDCPPDLAAALNSFGRTERTGC
jgi:hypothetical protein